MGAYINLYSNDPTKRKQDGIKISEGGTFSSPIAVVLDSSISEVVVKKMAIRCQEDYKTEGKITIKSQKLQLSSKTYSDKKNNIIYFAPDNNFTDEEQALTKGKWKKSLTIKETINTNNKIFWIKICSIKDEKAKQDLELSITISGKVKKTSISPINFTIHADIIRRISRKAINLKYDETLKVAKEYIDRFKKANYYKELITKSFLSKGIYPNEYEVQEKISKLNTSLSIFRHSPVVEGQEFDSKKFNENFFYIMQDLKILYETAYQICIKEYQDLKIFAETHLAELETLSAQYDYKSKYEINSTYLGNTIFSQTSGFKETIENQRLIISLGSITVHNGSKLACIFDGIDIQPTQVFFSFDGEYCSSYSLNKDFKIVGGEINCNKYQINITENTSINSLYKMVADNLNPTPVNKYIIYAGKNNVAYVETGKYVLFKEIENNKAITVNDSGNITFYILNGSYANFEFSTQPNKKNFTGNSITGLQSSHYIKIEHDSTLTFSINTDGVIYAVKRNGIVKDNFLYYPDNHMVNSFLIEEYDLSATTTYGEVKVIVNDCVTDTPPIINLIAIKELSTLEGVG